MDTKLIDELINKLNIIKDKPPINSNILINNIINTMSENSKIYIFGIGRSGFVGKSFAMRLMHLGYNCYFIGESTCPAVNSNDLLIVISGSGETSTVVNLLNNIKNINNKLIKNNKPKIKVISITNNNNCTLKELSDYIINLNIEKDKDNNYNENKNYNILFPLGTLFEEVSFIYLDTIIYNIMKKTNISEEDMKKRHCNFL